MPSPFPGMDPFIEPQDWQNFHVNLNVEIERFLIPRVRPRYIVRSERRVYVEREVENDHSADIWPDVAVAGPQAEQPSVSQPAVAAPIEPVTVTLPVPEPRFETYLTIRDRDTLEVVTVIEVLSPSNKRSGSDGRRTYLDKRATVLSSSAGLVELDLLRKGKPLPTVEPLPPGDYYAFVCRPARRRKADVYAWTLRDRLPAFPIPLASGDADVSLELQTLFNAVYDQLGYDYSLNYDRLPESFFSEAETAWVKEILARIN